MIIFFGSWAPMQVKRKRETEGTFLLLSVGLFHELKICSSQHDDSVQVDTFGIVGKKGRSVGLKTESSLH